MTAMEVLEKEREACLVVFRVQVLGSRMILSHSEVRECFKGLDSSQKQGNGLWKLWSGGVCSFQMGDLELTLKRGRTQEGKKKKKKAKSQIQVFNVAISSKLGSWGSGQVFIALLFLLLFGFCLFVCFSRFSRSPSWP